MWGLQCHLQQRWAVLLASSEVMETPNDSEFRDRFGLEALLRAL